MKQPRVAGIHPTIAGAALVLIALAAYAPLLWLGAGFIWGDDVAILDNPAMKTWGGIWSIWTDRGAGAQSLHFWPVTYSTFWLEYRMWGASPFGYHMTNILLHAVNTLLLWTLLRRCDLACAWLGAAIFAVHPLHVQSVAWVVQRKDLLSALFYLLAFLSYLRFDRDRRQPFYLAALGLFVLGMLSQSVVITLPAALAIWLWWRRDKLESRDLLPLVPFVLAALVVEWFSRFLMVPPAARASEAAANLDVGIVGQLLIAGRAICFYVWKLLAPLKLMMIYPPWEVDPKVAWQWLPVAGVVGAAVALWAARGRIGKAPVVGAALFLITLAPTLGLIEFGGSEKSLVADRFVYLASIGLTTLFAGGALRLAGGVGGKPRGLGILSVSILLPLMALSWRNCLVYESRETLWQHNIALNPKAVPPYLELGNLRLLDGRNEEAIAYFARAIELDPNYPEVMNSLGVLHVQNGEIEKAEGYFAAALELRPEYADVYYNLGMLDRGTGNAEQTVARFERALEIDPNFFPAHKDLAAEYKAAGRVIDAMRHLQAAVELDPEDIEVRYDLGMALIRQGDVRGAVKHFTAAVEANPDFALGHNALARVLASNDNFLEAIEHYREVIRLETPTAEVLNLLGEAHHRLGQTGEAIRRYDEAIRRDPNLAAAYNNMGAALISLGRAADAITYLHRALQLKPDYRNADLNLKRAQAMLGQ